MRTILLMLMLLPALLPRPALAAPVQPVTMTAFLDKPVYQIGQPIVLEVDLHNTGAREAVIGVTADQESLFCFLITEASGRIVPRTALGDRYFARLRMAAANAQVKIGPNATYRARFNLTDLFGLLRTGRYSLTASRTLGASIAILMHDKSPTLIAAPLSFQIVPAAALSSAPATPFVHDPNADENIP